MAWNTTLTERLRYYIYDIDSSNYTFTDVQLEKFLAISTIDVINDLEQFDSEIGGPYTINTSVTGSIMITPDPVDSGPGGFNNMIVARAACLISNAELKKAAAEGGWKIIDDRSTLDGTESIKAKKESTANYCNQYKDMLKEFKAGNRMTGLAILSPYQSSNFFRYGNNLPSPYPPSPRSM